jgi:hypothetical protein
LSVLDAQRIPEPQRRWYLLRAEAFLDSVRPTRMTEVQPKQVVAFFHRYSLEQSLSDWQFRQIVEAMQLLLIDIPFTLIFMMKRTTPSLLAVVGRSSTWNGPGETSLAHLHPVASCRLGLVERFVGSLHYCVETVFGENGSDAETSGHHARHRIGFGTEQVA